MEIEPEVIESEALFSCSGRIDVNSTVKEPRRFLCNIAGDSYMHIF